MNYTYNKNLNKVFGRDLSLNGIELKVKNIDYLLSSLENAFNVGQNFKSKQLKKLLKNNFLETPSFFIKDEDGILKVFGPDLKLNNSLYFTEFIDMKDIETVKVLLQKAFDSGKEERARQITSVLER